MVEILEGRGVFLIDGTETVEAVDGLTADGVNVALAKNGLAPRSIAAEDLATAREKTMAYSILQAHNTSGDSENLEIRFDALASHDITYVGIIQTAKASGLKEFPLPYVLTNCHNTLAAVGGTINEDDHVFGLSAAVKYGGIFVPPHQAVIHQYMREMMAGCGKMILGSDSHTRYGSLGTMAVGEGGPELVKQLLGRTWDTPYPQVVAIYLEGEPSPGIGPQDVALAIIGAVFANGYVKNRIMEFVGPGIANLSADFRNGVDVMTTETTCLSSIWQTDDRVKEWYAIHGREEAYSELAPGMLAYYDGLVKVDLGQIDSMIALPFHPSNTCSINELNENPERILKTVEDDAKLQFDNPDLDLGLLDKIVNGRIVADQGVVAGCAGGTFENLVDAAAILEGKSIGDGAFSLSTYPASQPVYMELMRNGVAATLMKAGSVMRSAFCGPCFGAGDVPPNRGFSIRHTTRNFPNREGARPGSGQIASVALMDARSVAATAAKKGVLTPATDVVTTRTRIPYSFDRTVYENRIYSGSCRPVPEAELKLGPNIKEWPEMIPLPENLLLRFASVINDPVTTTDELIPSGETSSYRSNPIALAEFTLSRRDPEYVGRAKAVYAEEERRRAMLVGEEVTDWRDDIADAISALSANLIPGDQSITDVLATTGLGSIIFAAKPGDGSAREQAASCQRVLGGCANIAVAYATKRYRSNLINWGMLPFTVDEDDIEFLPDDYMYIPGIRNAVESGAREARAHVISNRARRELTLHLGNLSAEERNIILAGSLINYYAAGRQTT